MNYFYEPIKLPDFESYLKTVRQVYRTYDTYIKDESSSKQKIPKKKSNENAYDDNSPDEK
jgi:hypothetical protein